MGAAKKGLAALDIEWDDGPNATLSMADIAREMEKASQKSGAPRIRSEVAADSVEPAPGAWARFERAEKVVAKSPPQHKTKTKGGSKTQKGIKTQEKS
jgi:hypothetical protein